MNKEDFEYIVTGIIMFFIFIIFPFSVKVVFNLTISESIEASIYFLFINIYFLIYWRR